METYYLCVGNASSLGISGIHGYGSLLKKFGFFILSWNRKEEKAWF